jgi:hypothetical protein
MIKIMPCCLLLVLAGSGCVSSPTVFSARLKDLEARQYYAARDTFRHDETPALVISGQSGHNVTVQLRKRDKQALLQTKTFYIKRDELKWIHWDRLPPGAYVAELVVRDQTNAVTSFAIEPAPDTQP